MSTLTQMPLFLDQMKGISYKQGPLGGQRWHWMFGGRPAHLLLHGCYRDEVCIFILTMCLALLPVLYVVFIYEVITTAVKSFPGLASTTYFLWQYKNRHYNGYSNRAWNSLYTGQCICMHTHTHTHTHAHTHTHTHTHAHTHSHTCTPTLCCDAMLFHSSPHIFSFSLTVLSMSCFLSTSHSTFFSLTGHSGWESINNPHRQVSA